MNPYALQPLIAAGLNLVLLAWVYKQAPVGMTRRTFLLWNSFVFLWNMSVGVGYLMTDGAQALAWYKATTPLAIAFVTPSFLHFVVSLTDSKPFRRWVIPLAYLSGIP